MSDTTAPERIFLQLGDEEITYSEVVRCNSEVSWCVDQIFNWDIPYVRADLYEQLQAENERLTKELQAAKNQWKRAFEGRGYRQG